MKEHIEKLKDEACEVHKLRETFFNCVKAWYESGEAKAHPVQEFGEYIDIIKDLAEAEKELAEACYFMSVVHAMHEAEEEDEKFEEWMERSGYNHNHYKSSGRFASAGHGVRMGYPHLPHVYRGEHLMYGYPVYYDEGEHSGRGDIMTGHGENGMPHYAMDEDAMEHGRSYHQYRNARRHYTETHDPEAKKTMNKHAKDHFEKTLGTLGEIWRDVDPEMKKKMRADLERTIAEMPA